MIPIQSLLHRLRWDPEFDRGDLTIGYYDRVEHRVVKVPCARIHLEPGNHFSFTAIEADGSVHDVPFHRVGEVPEPRADLAAPGATRSCLSAQRVCTDRKRKHRARRAGRP